MNIEQEEKTTVLLLIVQSVFLGTFYGAFDIGAHALFLDRFPAQMIPKAFVVSGFAGILMTSVYSWFQARMKFALFTLANLFFIAAVSFLLWMGFFFTGGDRHVFIIFVMMGPLNIIALLGFWGTVSRMFTLRQGKRLFGLIDTGQIFGIILASYAIPFLLSLQIGTRDLLLISAISILAALVFQWILTRKFELEKGSKQEEESGEKTGLFSLLKNPYVLNMSVFVGLSVMAAFFIHYSFLAVTKENYPENVDLAAFLGYFNGTLMVFSILIKTFVFSKLLKTYGLKLALVLSPILLFMFTVFAVLVGQLGGYTAAAASFTFFFLLISVSKLFSKALHDSIEAPSFKILYQSLNINIRYHVQARVDGTINEISALFSGLMLTGLGAIVFINLLHFSYFLLIILLAWSIAAFGLYRSYKRSLNESLARYKKSGELVEESRKREEPHAADQKGSPRELINTVTLYEIAFPEKLRDYIRDVLKKASGRMGKFLLNKIGEHELFTMKEALDQWVDDNPDEEIKTLAGDLSSRFDEVLSANYSFEQLEDGMKSQDPEKRKLTAVYIGFHPSAEYTPLVNILLRDHDITVRRSAIGAAGAVKSGEHGPVLVELLSGPLYREASGALVRMGAASLEGLSQAFYRTGVEEKTLVRIMRILPGIEDPGARALLMTHIDHYSADVSRQAVASLREMNYQAEAGEVPKMIERIKSHIGVIAWDFSASYSLEQNAGFDHLHKAFRDELAADFDLLYQMLSIAYDPRSIHHIRKNIETGTSESIGFAIELLDLFIAEDLKTVLFAVLEDATLPEKIRQLQQYYPVNPVDIRELLLSLINRNPNLVSSFTRACAVYYLNMLEDYQANDDLVAQLFNPDPMLRQVAGIRLKEMDPEKYASALRRLPEEWQHEMRAWAEDKADTNGELILEKVFYLLKNAYFSDLHGEVLARMARELYTIEMKPRDELKLSPDSSAGRLCFFVTGEVNVFLGEQLLEKPGKGDMIGFLPLQYTGEQSVTLRALKKSILYYLDSRILDELMYDHPDLARAIYDWMNESGQEKSEKGRRHAKAV